MNTNEIERIAAATNALRPDWPLRSLITLLHKPQLVHRPRRDVAVAMSWIASDPNTKTPGRILEAGPWWTAAAVDAEVQPRETFNPAEVCSVCSRDRQTCQTLNGSDHTYESIAEARQRRASRRSETVRV